MRPVMIAERIGVTGLASSSTSESGSAERGDLAGKRVETRA